MDFQLTNNSVRGENIGALTSPVATAVPPLLKRATNIHYGNMSDDTLAEKERLLKKWTFS